MLQIIGWLGCAYLFFRALEMAGSNNYRDENGKMNALPAFAMAFALIAALIFARAIYDQGQVFSSSTDYSSIMTTPEELDTGTP